jgi:methionine sulfoxide reductase heme-binding subunit
MLGFMQIDPTPHLFWITSRAAGFAALILASLAVSLGLLMSTKLLKGRTADLRVTHEVLSLCTLVAIVVHAVTLLGDHYLRVSVIDITVPFASSYKSGWTTLGIVSGWTLILLGLSYYARRSIGALRWRKLHRFTALAWIGGLVHSLGEGTDAGQVWFLAMVAIVALPALGLLASRLSGAGRRVPRAPRSGNRWRARDGNLTGPVALAARPPAPAIQPANDRFGGV